MQAKILKVVNNNVLIIQDSQGGEAVAMGCGIGFQKHAGEVVSKDKIQKIFVLSEKELNSKLLQLVSVLPVEHFILSKKIIEYVKSVTSWQLSDNIYITLTDHISAAIERQKQNISFENPLHWDIKNLYPEEYILGRKALDIIYEDCSLQFSDDEASYIALHFVNARINTDENMEYVHKVTKIIREITSIIKYDFHMEHTPDTLEYYQFVNYIKSLAPKILRPPQYQKQYSELFEVIFTHYQQVYSSTMKIQKVIEEQYHYSPTGEEMLFIAMCLSQIKNRLDETGDY